MTRVVVRGRQLEVTNTKRFTVGGHTFAVYSFAAATGPTPAEVKGPYTVAEAKEFAKGKGGELLPKDEVIDTIFNGLSTYVSAFLNNLVVGEATYVHDPEAEQRGLAAILDYRSPGKLCLDILPWPGIATRMLVLKETGQEAVAKPARRQ